MKKPLPFPLPVLRRLLPALLALLLLPLLSRAQVFTPFADTDVTVLSSGCNEMRVSWRTSRLNRPCLEHGSLVVVQDRDTITTTPRPLDGNAYYAYEVFPAGEKIANRQPAVYYGEDSTVNVKGLLAGHSYRIDVFSFCSGEDEEGYSAGPLYGPAASTGGVAGVTFVNPSCVLVPPPTKGTSRIRATVLDCSTLDLKVHPGNGQGRMLVVQQVPSVIAGLIRPSDPEQGKAFAPSIFYGQGQTLGRDAYPVTLGSDTAVVVYGLIPGRLYKIVGYEFNSPLDQAGNPTFQNLSYGIPRDTVFVIIPPCSTSEPTVAVRKLRQTDTLSTSAEVRFVRGNGTGRILVLRSLTSGSFGLSLPRQNTAYSPGPFGQGSETRPNAFVVGAPADTVFRLTNLVPGGVYLLSAYEYNLAPSGEPTYLLSQPAPSILILAATVPDPEDPLPVQLVRFEARRTTDGTARLSWSTATELNNDHFRIERSLDGRQFTVVGHRAGAGTSQRGRSYQFDDITAPAAALTYYRLCQLDLDGSRHYSSVVTLSAAPSQERLQLSPNPAQAGDWVTLALPGGPAGPLHLQLRSLTTGQLLAEADALDGARPRWQLPATLRPGLYLLQLSTPGGSRWNTRLLVR